MNKLQDTIKQHAFSDAEMLARIRLATQPKKRANIFCNKNIWISIGVAAAMLLVIATGGVVYMHSQQQKPTAEAIKYAEAQYLAHPLSYALVCVDINPSFEIYVDADGNAVEIDSVNEDARTLDVSSLIGLPVDKAITGIITLAEGAGFINSTDDIDDYIIVSTVLLTEKDEASDGKQDDLDARIEKDLADNETLDDTLKVAIIKATQIELFEARGKEIPMGLYVINGMIENNGVMIPVSEFVSNADHLKKLGDGAVIIGNGKKDTSDDPETSTFTSETVKVNETNPGHSGSQDAADASSSGNANITKPDNTKSDIDKPDNTKPENTKPDNTKPDTDKSDNTAPDNANANTNNANTNNDNAGNSKPTSQDETQAGNAVPDATTSSDPKEKDKGASADE